MKNNRLEPMVLYQARSITNKLGWWWATFWIRLWEIDVLPVWGMAGLISGLAFGYWKWLGDSSKIMCWLGLLVAGGVTILTAVRTAYSRECILSSLEELEDGSFRLEYREGDRDWVWVFRKEEVTMRQDHFYINTYRFSLSIRTLIVESDELGSLEFYRLPEFTHRDMDRILEAWQGQDIPRIVKTG